MSSSSSHQPPLRALDLLPPELLLAILSHLSVSELSTFSRASRSCHSLVNESQHVLYRAIAFNQGYTQPQTAGSTQAVLAPPVPLAAVDRAHELERVIAAQQSMSHHYAGVSEWKSFVRKTHQLRLAWKHSQPAEHSIKLQQGRWFGGGGVHRFKLDTEGLRIVTTGEAGGLQAFTTQGELVWYSTSPAHSYPHVEMSGPYIAISHGSDDQQFIMYRSANITQPPSTLTQEQHDRINSSTVTRNPYSPAYVPFAIIDPETVCLASKLRLPYLALVAAGQTGIHLFNILDGSKRVIDISGLSDPQGLADNRISYVELFGDYVLLAGSRSISAWHQTKAGVGTLPPAPPAGARRGNYRGTATPNYSAVHHDGSNLVAVSYGWRYPYDGHLMLSALPTTAENGSMEVVNERTFVLSLHAVCLQLAVENGKAVVITQHAAVFYALWLVDLTLATSDEDGVVRPAPPRCLCFPLPCHSLPSRVEMTSDQIFFPATSALAPGGEFRGEYERLKALANEHTLPWEWSTLEGDELSRAERGRLIEEDGAFAQRWMALLDRVDSADAKVDSLCVFTFAGDAA